MLREKGRMEERKKEKVKSKNMYVLMQIMHFTHISKLGNICWHLLYIKLVRKKLLLALLDSIKLFATKIWLISKVL
jgi:hypothetical protein